MSPGCHCLCLSPFTGKSTTVTVDDKARAKFTKLGSVRVSLLRHTQTLPSPWHRPLSP